MDAFTHMLAHYPQLLYGGFGATACAAGALIYRAATRKKPTHVVVNCWFCDQDTEVPYGNRNCWDCPHCEQYNGFQENGDYNKPIPAQYMEHLNHGVSAGVSLTETSKPQQWVNCQMLLCKKCNTNQALKIKQLASFLPREEEKYDEEIEVYKHHLEQTYKLCRPCQTAVEYYIKHQNRQLRALLFSHQLHHSRQDKAFVKSTYSLSMPVRVTFFRTLAFLAALFLLVLLIHRPDSSSPAGTVPVPPKPSTQNGSTPGHTYSMRDGEVLWRELLGMLPDGVVRHAQLLWDYCNQHQVAIVCLGLLTCLISIFLAGPVRLRRIDAVSCLLWLLVLVLYLLQIYTNTDLPWLDTAKLGAVALCCLVGFAAAAATRKSVGQRRARGRRYLSGCYDAPVPLLSSVSCSPAFIPSPPPNLSHLLSHHRVHKASPSSLPGRLSRALSLGTMPSVARTESGYLFSGSRPGSQYKDSPPSDYFSLKSGSRPSSPGPSPTPSVAGSITSTTSSTRLRRPLISPARLQLGGAKLQLFSSHPDPVLLSPPTCPSETCPSNMPAHSHELSFLQEDHSVCEDVQKTESSSGSSACLVDTTTCENKTKWKGVSGGSVGLGLLCASLTVNLVMVGVYLYNSWR